MIEIRIHGRGGQGVVIASRVLAVAAAKEGKRVQSFPRFCGAFLPKIYFEQRTKMQEAMEVRR